MSTAETGAGPAGVVRHPVALTDRIRVTGRIIRGTGARRVLEIGAGDHSFRAWGGREAAWTTVDMAPPCDVLCELNRPDARLPFEAGSFDLAVCTQVLEHLLWPQRLLAEMFQRLSIPLACLSFVLIGLPLSIYVRPSGKAIGVGIAFGLIMVYYVVMHYGAGLTRQTTGIGPEIGPYVIFLPNVVLTLIGGVLLYRAAHR